MNKHEDEAPGKTALRTNEHFKHMNNTLQTALIQSDLVWENPGKNRELFREKINRIAQDVDLIVLPEMFTTGFSMNAAAVAETMEGDTVAWMQKTARDRNAALTGSIIIKENGRYYNRAVFAHPSGRLDWYDKRHTFTLAGEHKVYASGNIQQIVDYNGWKLCLLICYDLRFPVWSRNTQAYDALIYVASWPEPRITAWDSLLKARAIENMAYCIGVNRTGTDGNGLMYPGHSVVYDALGDQLAFSDKEEALQATLHKDHIREKREKFRFLDDRDAFSLT